MDAAGGVTGPELRCASRAAAELRYGAGICLRAGLLAVLLSASLALPAEITSSSLPVLHTARQAHVLSNSQAERHYPVHLDRAQITYTIPGFAAFIQDATDGIYVEFPATMKLKLSAGDMVSVEGVSAPGDLLAVIEQPQFRILGHAPLPPAPLVSFDRLTTGEYDSRLVTLEGIVRSLTPETVTVATDSGNLITARQCTVQLASGQDEADITTLDMQGCARRDLVDAKVRLKAVAASRFNQRRQLIGIRFFTSDLSSVEMMEPAAQDPWELPLTDTAGVMRLDGHDPGHRVRVHGVVTSTWGAEQFSLMDSSYGIFVRTDAPVHLAVGEVLDVVGFPSWGGYTSVLEDAILRRNGSAAVPPPTRLTAAKALEGEHDAEPVEIDGQLQYKSQNPVEQTLVLTDAGTTFSAALPATAKGFSADLQPGSRLRVTGICAIDVNPDKTPKAVKILLQSPAGVVVLSQPSWWTPRKTLILAGILFAVVAVVVVWNVVLRGRVRGQTRLIREQLREAEELRMQAEEAHREKSQSLADVLSLQQDLLEAQDKLRYQATHDVLTGMWNRGALLELLHAEMERCLRNQTSMGVLMLDLDHFKPVNDTYGHLAGDAVLQAVAERIGYATRPYDVSGRYGGEEFLVILPDCDREQTANSAERIRGAISAAPFRAGGGTVSLTVSIGATVAGVRDQSETELLSLADLALYEAKSAGRNCTVLRFSFSEQDVGQA